MPKNFNFTIVTPNGKKLADECEILNVETTAGAMGVLSGHLPMVAILEIGTLNYVKNGKRYFVAVNGGVLNVKKDGVTVLAESFETKEEIDKERAEASMKRANDRLESNDESIDIERAKLSLKRAMNRLKITTRD